MLGLPPYQQQTYPLALQYSLFTALMLILSIDVKAQESVGSTDLHKDDSTCITQLDFAKNKHDRFDKYLNTLRNLYSFNQSKYLICYEYHEKKEFVLNLINIRRLTKQIKIQENSLKKNNQREDQAKTLFHLAELHAERASLISHYVQNLDMDTKATALIFALIPDFKRAHFYYLDILNYYQSFTEYDFVLHRSTAFFDLIGLNKLAAELRLKLKAHFPHSNYRSENLFRLGDYYFQNDFFFESYKVFTEVMTDESYSERPRVWNRYAYSILLINHYEKALEEFKKLIKYGESKKHFTRLQQKSYAHIKNLAFTGAVRSIARLERPTQRLTELFNKLAPDELESQFQLLASTLEKIPRKKEAIIAYKSMLNRFKQSKEIDVYISRYINLIYYFKSPEKIYKSTNNLLQFYPLDKVESKESEIKKEEHITKQQAIFKLKSRRELILNSGIKIEKIAETEEKGNLKLRYYKYALTLYQQLIEEHKEESEEKVFAMMRVAELSAYDFKQWQNAVNYYLKFAEVSKDRMSVKESMYKAILAAEELMASKTGRHSPQHFMNVNLPLKANESTINYEKITTTSKKQSKQDLHQSEVQFIKVAKRYIELFPLDNDTPVIIYKTAQVMIDKGHYQKGTLILRDLISNYPKHKYASHAIGLLIDALATIKSWSAVEFWARKMMTYQNFLVYSKAQLINMILLSRNTRVQNTLQKLKENDALTARDRDYEILEAMKLLSSFNDEFPNHPQQVSLLANIAYVAQNLSNLDQSVRLFEQLIKAFPNHTVAQESIFTLANLYASQTQFERAAQMFKDFALQNKSVDKASLQAEDSLIEAISIYKALGDYPQAIQCLKELSTWQVKTTTQQQVAYDIALMYEKQKDWVKAIETYKSLYKLSVKKNAEQRVILSLKLAQLINTLYESEGTTASKLYIEKGIQVFNKLNQNQKNKVKSSFAELLFLLAEYEFREFRDYKLISYPQTKLQKTLIRKAELHQKAEKTFQKILKLRVIPTNIKVLARFSDMYQLFADTLTQLPVPQEIKAFPEEVEAYQIYIEEKILPLEEKSIQSAQTALDLARKYRIYDEWSAKAVQRLLKLQPNLYPINGSKVLNTDWIAPSIDHSLLKKNYLREYR